MDTISPLSSIPPVGSATSQSRGQQSGGSPLGQGQLVKALVLRANSDTQFVLQINNNTLTASSESKLRVGQNLQLQVTKTSPQIELKIVTDTLNQFVGRSITLLGKNLDISSLFNGLQTSTPTLLDTLTPTSKSIVELFHSLQQSAVKGEAGGTVLKQLVENLGLSFENQLANNNPKQALSTLKAALLEVAHTFSSAEKLADVTSKLLTSLELFQFAQLHRTNESHLIFPLPLPFIEQGYLLIERGNEENQAGGDDKAESRFSLYLTMTELGNLQIDFLRLKDSLSIKVSAETDEKAAFMKSFSEDLLNSISDVSGIQVSFSAGAPDPIRDLIREMIPAGDSMLDTRV